jgi:hypothetical protein
MQESYFGTKIAVISDNPGYIASELIQAFTGEEKFIEHDGEQIKRYFRRSQRKVSDEDSLFLRIHNVGGRNNRHELYDQNVFVLHYKIDDRQSFETVQEYFDELSQAFERGKQSPPTFVLVANNSPDLEPERAITKEEGLKFSQKMNCPFFEISLENQTEIDTLFELLVEKVKLLEKKKKVETEETETKKETKTVAKKKKNPYRVCNIM